jgi:hypothetical protein
MTGELQEGAGLGSGATDAVPADEWQLGEPDATMAFASAGAPVSANPPKNTAVAGCLARLSGPITVDGSALD